MYRMIKRDDYFYKRVISYAFGTFIASMIYANSVESHLMELGLGVYERSQDNVPAYTLLRTMHDGLIMFIIGAGPALLHLRYYGRIRNFKQVASLTLWSVAAAFVIGHIVFTLTLEDTTLVPMFREALMIGWIFGGFVHGYARVLFFDNWRYD